MHKSYCIQDGCHNCRFCMKGDGWQACMPESIRANKPPSQVTVGECLNREVRDVGKCDEWKANK